MSHSPMIQIVDDLAEGVYMASGATGDDNCFTIIPGDSPRYDYTKSLWYASFHVEHNADHTSNRQTITVTFNHPVTYNGSQAVSGSSNGSTVTMDYAIWYDHSYSFDENKLEVYCDSPELQIVSATIVDTGKQSW